MNISVLGLWRNSEKHIYKTLSSLESLSLLGDFSFYFYENDSTDNTLKILQNWTKENNGKIIFENINAPSFGSVPDVQRIILLSYYRNKAKQLILDSNSEYTLLLDTDILFDNNDFLKLYDFLNSNSNCVMVTSNTRQYQIKDLMLNETEDSFYDVSAFRDYYNNNGLYFTDCPFILEDDRNLWKKNKPIKVKSGFGGFSLIKTEILKKSNVIWSTCGHIEHVNFCNQISQYGEIYILPYCKPKTEVNLSSINLEACSNIAKNQLNIISQINQIYNLSVSSKIKIQ
jgi:GT2 family glycosyltransferase